MMQDALSRAVDQHNSTSNIKICSCWAPFLRIRHIFFHDNTLQQIVLLKVSSIGSL